MFTKFNHKTIQITFNLTNRKLLFCDAIIEVFSIVRYFPFFLAFNAMARRRKIYNVFCSISRQRISAGCATYLLSIVLFVSILSTVNAWPWFNNTCKEDQLEYSSNCEDEFQNILDENSIIISNSTGKYCIRLILSF